jgi:CheY-like chemotaxis protein
VLAQSADDNIKREKINSRESSLCDLIGGSMKKVVVAEASPTIKSVADSLLRQNGYDVVCTSDGVQAWDVIAGEKPDLVLIGQGLSGISGLDLCLRISNDNITGGIPVVIMIGAKDGVTEEQFIASGARGKLRKPFSPKDLLDVVERLTGQGNAKPTKVTEPVSIQQAKFSTQVSSSQQPDHEKESYNLEWLDLKDVEQNGIIPKVASFDTSGDDVGLVISEDQYGLSSQQFEPDPEPEYAPPPLKKDEDYEWFLGEIKKEMEGKAKNNQKAEPDLSFSAATTKMPARKPDEPIKFDDLASANEQNRTAPIPKAREKVGSEIPPATTYLSPRPENQKDTTNDTGVGKLTEDQIVTLADRIATRLASQIASRIDRNLIMEAIKAAIKR